MRDCSHTEMTEQVNILEIMKPHSSLLEKDVTYMEREKIRMNPVVLDCKWRH